MDDMYEPDKCKANTDALINKEDVFALFGYVGTPTSLAALPLVNQHKVPFFGPFTGAEALRDPFSRYVFHVRASYYDETALIVKQLTSLNLKKIAIFRQNDSYGQAGYDGVVRALKALNLDAGGAWAWSSATRSPWRRPCRPSCPRSPTRWCRSVPTRAAPRSSARRARPATAARSTTCRSSARRRWPTSWAARRWAWWSAR